MYIIIIIIFAALLTCFSLVTLSSKIDLQVHSSGFPFATSYGSASVLLESIVREHGGNGNLLDTRYSNVHHSNSFVWIT